MVKKPSLFKRVYWWLFVVRLSFRWVFKINIGDAVLYKGKRCTLTQGVSNPYWNLMELKSRTRHEHVHCDQFRKERTLSNYIGSFKSGYRFYMGYWYWSWVNGGIKPWMRGCNIWQKN